MNRTTTVAVMSTGDMGTGVARRLRRGGVRVVTALEGRSLRTRAGAEAAGVEDAGSLERALAEAEIVLSIVPPARALELATSVGRDAGPLYVDCNAVSPATARRIADAIGDRYIDAAIIGGPQAPRFYASGPLAAELTRLPLDVRVIDGPIGHASALKMCYAALTKGLTALLTESTTAAAILGVADHLHAELADSQPQFLARARSEMPRMLPKAYRWIAEMEEIADTLGSVGLTPQMLLGAADVYRLVEAACGPDAAFPAGEAADTDEAGFAATVDALRRKLAPGSPAR